MILHITFSHCLAILFEQIEGLSKSREKSHGHVYLDLVQLSLIWHH